MHRKYKLISKLIISILSILMLNVCVGCRTSETSTVCGVFSWKDLPENIDIDYLSQNGINTIIQYMKSEYSDNDVYNFMDNASDYHMDVYVLAGEPEWAYEDHYEGMKKVLDNAKSLNKKLEKEDTAGIKGIVYDIEPYVLKDWDEKADILLDGLCSNLINISKEKEDLEILICIPYYYDSKGYEDELNKLIECTDGIMVMNYYKGSEIEHIENEEKLASFYGKDIINIYELKKSGEHGITDNNTYHDDGIDEVNNNYKELKDAYPDYSIGIAYHDMSYFKEKLAE